MRRLPGGLAPGDIAVLIGRLVAYRSAHTPRFLADEVAFVTGAGHNPADPGWRTTRRLPGAGVVAAVTDKAVMKWADTRDAVRLVSVHEGATVDEVVEGSGFALQIEPSPATSEVPPPEALEILRNVIDPYGIRRLEVRETRPVALAALERRRT
jgi:acyl CoA:acetate/3-ketoacid CoA transferase beta subunit